MPVDLSALTDKSRLLFEIPLKPLQGERFQPTGFPNLGAATFRSKRGDCLLVESAQSMANRLEATIWDSGRSALQAGLEGLSYVEVKNEKGEFLTSSILEAHRLNSVYIENADGGSFHKAVAADSNYDEKKPVNRAAFLRAVLKYDVNSLLHGAFMESIGGRLRVARAISSFIESEGIRVVASGGVKNDHVTPGKEEGKDAAEGYGNVPFARDEFVADRTILYVNLDLAQIRGYGLGPDVEKMLVLLALFKLRSLLEGDLRLRTACDLALESHDPVVSMNPIKWALPTKKELFEDLKESIKEVKPQMESKSVVYSSSSAKKETPPAENSPTSDDQENE